ncbi:hypothetical protein HED60_19450 [Planctomycetales bacterium ZRK34]|nr:hypothetical protein HED60_19450 [Planctomycetales bacterium ZRK34]
MRYYHYCILLLAFMGSCKMAHDISTSSLIADASGRVEASAESIEQSAKTVKAHSTNLASETQEPQTQARAEVITAEADRIIGETASLKDVAAQLADARQSAQQQEQKITELQQHLKDAQQSAANALRTIMGIIVAASVVAVGASVFLMLSGMPKLAIGIGGAAITTAVVAVAVMTHLVALAWAGAAAIAVIFALIVWQLVALWRTERTKDKAVAETVTTVEEIKQYLPASVKSAIFGEKPKVERIQSPKTKQIIGKQKSKMRGKAARLKAEASMS